MLRDFHLIIRFSVFITHRRNAQSQKVIHGRELGLIPDDYLFDYGQRYSWCIELKEEYLNALPS